MVIVDGWDIVGASVLGSRHVRSGQPNQDSSAWGAVGSGSDAIAVLAVGDGHGGRRYVRSELGSAIAVRVAVDEGQRAAEAGVLDGSIRQIEKAARDLLIPTIVRRWQEECLAHLESSPFTGDETALAGANLDVDPLVAYGSTLLLGILGPSQSLLLQLGDGDCIVGAADSSAHTPVPYDPRLYGGETTSLCLPDAVDDFRVAVIGHLDPTIVVLATDGYGVAFADADWRAAVVQDLSATVGVHGSRYLEDRLDGWLKESAEVGGDDVTVLVASRSAPALPRLARSSARAWLLVLAALLGILLGGLVGWGFGYRAGTGQETVFDGSPEVEISPAGAVVTTEPDDPSREEMPGTTIDDDLNLDETGDVGGETELEGGGEIAPPETDAPVTTDGVLYGPR